MRIPGTTFYPAHPTNFTAGRNRPINKFTVHHSAGWEQTLRYLWADPARNGSSTLYVSGAVREQYVDTDDTPWTNGNFSSNSESITCEVRGDWRNGYYDQATLNNLEEVMYQCLKVYPHLQLTFHMDVTSSSTLCPADLKHRGFATQVWNNAKARIARENAPKPAPTPAPVAITYRAITPKRVVLKNPANLWNFNFSNWNAAQSIQSYPAGHVIDVVAIAKNALGGEYYMTAYSYNNGAIRATNGFNIKDCVDFKEPIKEDQKPIDTNPVIPGAGDVKPEPPKVDPPIVVTPPVVPTPEPTPTPVPTPDPVVPPSTPEVEVIPAERPYNIGAIAIRVFSTFYQAFIGVISAALVTGIPTDQSAVLALIGAGIAAGVSAVKNIVVKPQEVK